MDLAVQAIYTEIVLLGAPLPEPQDIGDGGVRIVCPSCGWFGEEMSAPWFVTDYEVPALRRYVKHVREQHGGLT